MMTKKQAQDLLKQAKADHPGVRMGAAYIRTNRRDLGEAYKLLHPNLPAVRNWNWWNKVAPPEEAIKTMDTFKFRQTYGFAAAPPPGTPIRKFRAAKKTKAAKAGR